MSQIGTLSLIFFFLSLLTLVVLVFRVRRLRTELFQEVDSSNLAASETIASIYQQLHQLSTTLGVINERSAEMREAQRGLQSGIDSFVDVATGGIDRATETITEAVEGLEDASITRNVAQMTVLNTILKSLSDHIALQSSLQERRSDETRYFEGMLEQIIRSMELQKAEFTPSNPGKLDWTTFKRLARDISSAHEENKA